MSHSRKSLAEIETALQRVEDCLHSQIGGHRSREEVLKAIFALNNAVGRGALTSRKAKEDLMGLQLEINLITVGVKTGNMAQSKEGIRMASESIQRLRASYR